MARPEVGGDIGQIVHVGDIDPGFGHGDDHIGMAEFEVAREGDRGGAGLAGFVDQVTAGDAQVDAAANEFAGDLGGREEAHRHIGQAFDGAKIRAGAARTGDSEAAPGEPVAGQFFKAALGGHGKGNGHFGPPF